MNEEAGLLSAILDEPDADVHRLVYADWLDDHDQPRRAAFIRAQIALTPFLASGADPFEELRGVTGLDLDPACRDEFLAPFFELGGTFRVAEGAPLGERVCQAYTFLFVRGFVEAITIHGGRAAFRFADQAEVVFARTPLQHLRVTLFAHREPVVVHFESDVMTTLTVRRLVQAEGLRQLRSLDLRRHYIEPAALSLLLDCPHLTGLRDLWLDDQDSYPAAALRDALHARFGNGLH